MVTREELDSGARRGDTRDRMLSSAVALLGQRGTAGTTMDAVLAHSGAPRGSIYHHFPGGRSELVVDAVRLAGDRIAGVIDPDLEPREALQRFASFWKAQLVATEYKAGCPVVALTVGDVEAVPQAEALVADVFAKWHARFVALLVGHGFRRRRAERLATLTISAVEGAVVLCRAERSSAPLEAVIAELVLMLDVVRNEASKRDRDAAGRPRQSRPRDALGRPLPYGASGVEPVPEEPLPPSETVDVARRLVHEGRPFAAHEVLEARWKAGPVTERDLWQGLAQLCVGLTHAERGNSAGAARLVERGAGRLEGYQAAGGPTYGLDLTAVVTCAQSRTAAGR